MRVTVLACAGMGVIVVVRMPVRIVFMVMGMAMLVIVLMRLGIRMRCFRFLRPEFFPRQLLFAGSDHVELGCTDAAAVHARNLQARIHAQGFDGAGKDLRRNSGVQQGAQEHIAADSGKAF